ncbi:unnamed protein product [Adineta ricciae]|uniref:EGF-like domain-containing protein n=1 Tax=Adineta ricciae TaxID=249248 RepID=A0A815EVW3_ADIRI|nr:unnamed protein product [Adineta ricciae]
MDDEDSKHERVKRFLLSSKKKTTPTTKKPSTGVLASLIPTTPSNKHSTSPDFSSGVDKYGKKFNTACNSKTPCLNGGSCRKLPSGRPYCHCTEQFYGRNCEKKYKSTGQDQSSRNACSSSPCLHGGECVPKGSSFLCRCKSPYYGPTCSKHKG